MHNQFFKAFLIFLTIKFKEKHYYFKGFKNIPLMFGWLIQTICSFYFQLYSQTFGRIISLLFPTFLFDLGKNSAHIIRKYLS